MQDNKQAQNQYQSDKAVTSSSVSYEDEFLELNENNEQMEGEKQNNITEEAGGGAQNKHPEEFIREELEKQENEDALHQEEAIDNGRPEKPVTEDKKESPLNQGLENNSGKFPSLKVGGQNLQVSDEDTQSALQEKMRDLELKRQADEARQMAGEYGLPFINLSGLPIMPEALELIDENEARQAGVVCFLYKKNQEIRLAALKLNEAVLDIEKRLQRQHPGCQIKKFLTSPQSLEDALKLYKALPKTVEKAADDINISTDEVERITAEFGNLNELKNKIERVTASQLFSLILAAAIKTEASDIHLEAAENNIVLRFRIDGVLHTIAELNSEAWSKLSARIKLKAGLKINISDKPQDGNFSVKINGQTIDFRVSTLPTTYGESIVMRILYHEKVKRMNLENLGLIEYNLRIIEEEIKKPNGLVVVTGPTGSGKTTTLYAILNKLNNQQNKIITVEDPVEYKINGINQSEVDAERGYTFAKALRSIVRQDPDIILVGEIRDKETTEIALNAALTGHLVFTTLHTNNAVGAVIRFLALGAKPYLLAPALNISIAQRLVRRLCPHCRYEEKLDSEKNEIVRQELQNLPEEYQRRINLDISNLKFYKARGCEKCAGLGYKGQVGIFEIFKITDDVRNLILNENVNEVELNKIAKLNGMLTMRQDGILKAGQGLTSLEEVLRVA